MLQTYNNLIAKYSIRNYYIITYLIHTTTARHTPGGNIHGIQPLSGHIPIFFNYIHNHIHILTLCLGSYRFVSEISGGLVPTMDMSPPDVKVETTFFQRKFFSTTPSNYPQKQYKKRTSDLSEVPILRCFLKTLPLSTPLPASYQIPPNCTLNDISP